MFGAAGEFVREAVAVGVEAEGADDLFDVVGRVGDASASLRHGEEIGGVELRADAQVCSGSCAMGEEGAVIGENGGGWR